MTARFLNTPAHQNVETDLSRRHFLKSAAGTALVATGLPTRGLANPSQKDRAISPESLVGRLYHSLSGEQKNIVCFDWDHQDPKRGLLRTFIANNWNITPAEIHSDFYSREQQALIRDIFEGLIQPDWHDRFDKQLKDDCGGFGHQQSIAIFGEPGKNRFEFVLSGRHMTLRCDGNSEPHMAFGGPIFYGHAADGFHEAATHPGNVFWPQAVAANKVYAMLDGRQQKQALIEQLPREQAVAFREKATDRPGIPIRELSEDQRAEMQKVLATLIEPYRQMDRNEVQACLKSQGGLDACHLAFYSDQNIGQDALWDNWRLEGPAFVWYFRGSPHVHCWVHVADNPRVPLNA